MQLEEAIAIKDKIEKICKENDLWYEISNKIPKEIIFKEITIKINNG